MDSPRSDIDCWFAAQVQPHEAMFRAWLRRRGVFAPEPLVESGALFVMDENGGGKLSCDEFVTLSGK